MRSKIIGILVVALCVSLLLGFLANTLAPTFGNDVALGQLENDDTSFIIMQSWTGIQNILNGVQVSIWLIAILLIVKEIYKYIKNKKENM